MAIRIRKKQGELFADGSEAKYFAVVTNVWEWETKRLLEWHRQKASTIEAIHDVVKNELAAGEGQRSNERVGNESTSNTCSAICRIAFDVTDSLDR